MNARNILQNSDSPMRTRTPSGRWRKANVARCCAVALVAILATALRPATAANVDGALDPSWAPRNSNELGIPGLIEDTYNLAGGGTYNGNMSVSAVSVQADGNIVTAGFGWNTNIGTDQNACVLRRFQANGDYDASFGNDGAVVVNFSAGGSSPKLDCYFNSVAVQPDGKIVAAGQLVFGEAGVTPSGLVMRFNPDGTWDTSFGDSGGYSHFVLDFTQVLVLDSGQIAVAGTYSAPNFTDTDYYLGILNANGILQYYRAAHFDLGGDKNDMPTAAVVENWSVFFGGAFHSFNEIYLSGIADTAAYPSGMGHHACAVAAFVSADGGSFAFDTSFAGSGQMTTEFAVGNNDTDTICRAAARRPAIGAFLSATGIVVGGERYFSSATGTGDESLYALAEIDAGGNVTRHDDFALFQDWLEPGAFNSIFAMGWDDTGKLLTAGYAGIGANGDQTHAPSDMGLRRYNADYSSDTSFGTFTPGTSILSLDGATSALLPSQREWANALALDPLHARAIVVGERSPWLAAFPNKYYWMLGAVHDGVQQVADRIFANGFD